MKKAQAIIFVLFVLAVFGALSGALTIMWQAQLQTRASERDGLMAFYLAQAGAERGKRELASDLGWGMGACAGPYSLGGGTYTVCTMGISCPPGPYLVCRRVISIGLISSARREVITEICIDSPPLDPNTPGDESVLDWGWYEN